MNYKEAAQLIRNAKTCYAFTGAGISVESGIPPFRGEGGLWQEYDPSILDLSNYLYNAAESWPAVKRLFFDFFGNAEANAAHIALAKLEMVGLVKGVITQNIDNLHQEAGSRNVIEFHGNCRQFVCTSCGTITRREAILLDDNAPWCPKCGSLIKPDFIFFGEGIPEKAYDQSNYAVQNADLLIVIGTTGEVYPASHLPEVAKSNGAKIIEINTSFSNFTNTITDLYLHEKASVAMLEILKELGF